MSFGKKVLFSTACALFAASLAGFILMGFHAQLRSLIVIIAVTAVVCAFIYFAVSTVLNDKETKFKVIATTAISIVSIIAMLSSVVVGLAPVLLFPCNHNEEAYDELMKLSRKEESRISQVTAGDYSGWRISASEIPEGKPRPVVLMFYGNGMNASKTALMVYEDKDDIYHGFTEVSDMVIIDYPGYGVNDGVPGGDTLRMMALTAYDEVSSWSTTSEVISFGYSIGTGPATYLASEREVGGLILWAPYANTYDLYNNYLDIFHGPFKLMVTYKMDNYKYIKSVTCPTLILASDTDEEVPYQSSRDLFTNSGSTVSDFVTIQGITHNDFWTNDKSLDNTFEFIRLIWEVS